MDHRTHVDSSFKRNQIEGSFFEVHRKTNRNTSRRLFRPAVPTVATIVLDWISIRRLSLSVYVCINYANFPQSAVKKRSNKQDTRSDRGATRTGVNCKKTSGRKREHDATLPLFKLQHFHFQCNPQLTLTVTFQCQIYYTDDSQK